MAGSMTARWHSPATEIDLAALPDDPHRDDGEHRQPRRRLPLVAAAGQGGRPRPHGVHHQRPDQGPSDGAGALRSRCRTRAARQQIATLTRGYADPSRTISWTPWRAASPSSPRPIHPHPAIVRLSDFKTNEYAHLLGGTDFEPEEENPMLGLRGASRYYDERYREGFALECRAVKQVRETDRLRATSSSWCRSAGRPRRPTACLR